MKNPMRHDERIYNMENIPCWGQAIEPATPKEETSSDYDRGRAEGVRAERNETKRIVDEIISDLQAWRARL